MKNLMFTQVLKEKASVGNTNTRFYELDFFRFFAAFVVLMFHYTFRGAAADNLCLVSFPDLGVFFRYGYFGVHLFFMVSGFVILQSALNKSTLDFLLARAARLYPAFVVGCTLTYASLVLSQSNLLKVDFWGYLANLTMFAGFFKIPYVDGVYWSLNVEIIFYFLVAALIFTKKIQHYQSLSWLWLAICVLYHAILKNLSLIGVGTLNMVLLLSWAPFFVAGMTFYDIYTKGINRINILLLLASFGISLYLTVESRGDLQTLFHANFSEDVIVLTAIFIIFSLGIFNQLRFLNKYKGLVTQLGALTYPLYLIHQNLGYFIFNRFYTSLPPYVLLIIIIVLMVGISFCIHKFIEKPVGRFLSKQLKAHSQARPLPTDEMIPKK